MDRSMPLPEKYLLARYRPVFEKINSGKSATLLALPQTGRTSLLRFILASPKILNKLSPKNIKFIFIDIDKTGANFESFLSEILINISGNKDLKNILLARDSFLLSDEIYKQVKNLSKNTPLCFVVTLNKAALPIFAEIDRLLVFIRKCQTIFPVTIIWSIDTTFYKNFRPGHSASNLLENITYFKSFNKEETVYNLKRFYLLKGKKIPGDLAKTATNLTGGIAGLFHPLTNDNLDSPLVDEIITSIKKDFEDLPRLSSQLLTHEAINFINKFEIKNVRFESFQLNSDPTAQEINLLRFLKTKLNVPVSRDDIAQIIWGPGWERKYSDWAIDKTVSRLRKKIKSKDYQILTVKNLGYELVDFNI